MVSTNKHHSGTPWNSRHSLAGLLLVLPAILTLNGCWQSTSSGSNGSGKGGTASQHRPEDEVLVPAGSFFMGSADGESDERPVTRQQVAAFYLDKFEVTNGQYRRFLAAVKKGAKRLLHPDCPKDKDHTPSPVKITEMTYNFPRDYFDNPAYDKHPVVGIDWFDAWAYAAWCGRRLPSEVEWEYAAASSENRLYPWGSDRPHRGVLRANYYTPRPKDNGNWDRSRDRLEKFGSASVVEHVDGFPFLAPVGSFPAGAARCGALDMAGNVWEWTSSVYLPYGGKKGPKLAKNLNVLRGGAWDSPSSFLFRCANRVACDPLVRRSNIGFRTARNAEAKK